MRDLGYERVSQLVAVSAIGKHNSSLSTMYLSDQSLSVGFTNYVKSQLHLDIVGVLFSRDVCLYSRALHLIEKGAPLNNDSSGEVLNYFYVDMAGFLINNPSNMILKIDIDPSVCEKSINVDISLVKQSLQNIIRSIDSDSLFDLIENFEYSEIIDDVDSLEELIEKIDSFAVASVLKYYSGVECTRVVLEGYNAI